MGIMDLVRKWQEGKKQKSEKFKEMEENYRLQKMLEDRQKSSAQRELERHYKDKQEDQYKSAVDKLHQQQTKEAWKGKSLLKSENNILKEDSNIASSDGNSILKKRNFLGNKNTSKLVKHEMFFKW